MKAIVLIAGILASGGFLAAQSSTQGQANEVQAYLEKAKRGEAGVNPRDQTAARSGDPYAMARVRHQMANNQIAARLNAGHITAQAAAAERVAASNAYQQELAAIEQERLLQEMRRQNRELEKLNRELERRRYLRR